ncbi:BTB/POZ domain-containing protein 6-like [Saccostrea cucullata]|uniref:BTB/POZ domain-containing protein 6-like n=1 Tax=Saccostrea cuccullata TaxID=36930 RepID=UPI002ED0787E
MHLFAKGRKMTEVKTSKNWRSGLSVADCNRYMLENEIHCDVLFRVGKEEKLVRAHKYVLASRSPVFDAMFYGDLAEAKEIKIPDIEPPSFDVLLRFVYCGEVEVNKETAIGALYAAEKYDIEALKKATISYLKSNITTETVCTFLENAKLFHLERLTKKCIEFINEKCSIILQLPISLQISKDTLMEILSSDNLDIEELKVYHFLISWGEGQCELKGYERSDENIRNQIGDALYQVRFQFMDLDTFVKNVCRRNILTSKDKLILQQVIVGNLEKESTKFNLGKRKPALKTYNVIRRSSPLKGSYSEYTGRRQDRQTFSPWGFHVKKASWP